MAYLRSSKVNDVLPSSQSSNRNIIINGAMAVNQRGDYGTTTTLGYKGADRWYSHNAGLAPANQVVYSTPSMSDGPDGIRNSTKIGFHPSYNLGSVGSDDVMYQRYRIEARDVAHLQYGTASAKDVTLSFYVKTNCNTGGANTFAIACYCADGDRVITTTYTASHSGWQRYTWTVPGDTGGTINDDSGPGMEFRWYYLEP